MNTRLHKRGRPDRWRGLRAGGVVLLAALASAVMPPPSRSVADWAEAERMVAPESGSPEPGKWSNDLTPYTVEPMECLSFSHPCRSVTFVKSHQVGGSEVGVNLFGYIVDHAPSPIAIVLPTIDEGSKYERLKLQPTITATPALRGKVRTERSRARDGSTVTFKRFRGGYAQITGANSSSGLQMISVRVAIFEEISEWPDDTGNRGDPLTQAEKRLTAWARYKPKRFYVSTPKVKDFCRITAKYEGSDQRRYYIPCPQCGAHQHLTFDQVKWRSDTAPHGAYLVCKANGCVIEHHQKRDMVARGRWVPCYPDGDAAPGQVIEDGALARYIARPAKGREPGFHIWQVYSPFVGWDDLVAEYLEAKDQPLKYKVFVQQILGEPYAETGEAPAWEELQRRAQAIASHGAGECPNAALFLTMGVDVQADRLEASIWGWGFGRTSWLIEHEVIEGNTAQPEVWAKLSDLWRRNYLTPLGRERRIECTAVDSGYRPTMTYDWTRGKPQTISIKGASRRTDWPIGGAKKMHYTPRGKLAKFSAINWMVGSWFLKEEIYSCLKLDGPNESGGFPPGFVHLPSGLDDEAFRQLTAEQLVTVQKRDGTTAAEWRKSPQDRNEVLDCAVYARAAAYHLGMGRMTLAEWERLAAERGAPPEEAQLDLLRGMAGPAPAEASADAPAIRTGRSKYLS